MADRACVVVIDGDQLLLVQQWYHGQTLWTFPGGTIEPGETPEAAAERETFEETGLKVELIRTLLQTDREVGTGKYFCFLGHIAGGELKVGRDPELATDAQELRDVRWFPLRDVRQHREVTRIWDALAVSHLIGEDRADL